jgi:hypothetical protein
MAGAAAEDAEVVGVLEILSEYDVAIVEERGELRDGEVPDAPWILEVVGYTGVEDEAPPRVGGFVDRSEGLDEEREGAVAGDQLNDALPRPGSELGAKGDLGGLVALPAGVVGLAGLKEGKAGLGHAKSPFHDSGGHCVEWAEALVPFRGGVENRHEVACGLFKELYVLRHEAGGKVGASGRTDQARGGSGGGLVEQRVGGADGYQRLGREEERQAVGVGGLR